MWTWIRRVFPWYRLENQFTNKLEFHPRKFYFRRSNNCHFTLNNSKDTRIRYF